MDKRHVLLAEDDIDFGSILKQYLEIHTFKVTWAKDGKEALELFVKASKTNEMYSICVFDVMMPKLDGFTLAEKVLEIEPEIPFVFLTAKKMKEDRIKGLKLGADDYIVKPFEADILVLRLKNILKRTSNSKTNHQSKNNHSHSIGSYVFDPLNHHLTLKDEVQHITEKEVQLIQYLYQHRKPNDQKRRPPCRRMGKR